MVYVLLGDGFEEIEAISVIDILRRGNVLTKTVSVSERRVLGAHGIPVLADCLVEEVCAEDAQMVVLPGGMGGVQALEASQAACSLICGIHASGGRIAAICAAPTLLTRLGLTAGKKAVCYPGLEDQMGTAQMLCGHQTAVDGNLITGQAPGAAVAFGLKLVEILQGAAQAAEVAAGLVL